MSVYLFFIVFLVLFLSIHTLFYLRVVRKLLHSSTIKKTITVLLALNFGFNFLYVLSRYTDLMTHKLYYFFSLSIGISFMIFLYLILHEILHIFHFFPLPANPSRRAFFKKSSDSLMLSLGASYVSVATYEGNKEPIVKTLQINLFDFSIVQISDLHIGGLIDRDFVRNAVKQINQLKPDIVCITGDLIDTDIHSIQESIKEIESIHATYGIYYILGNHEYFHNPLALINYMQTTSIKLLLNESITIDPLKVNIVGLTDLIGHRMKMFEPDIHKAFSRCNAHYPTILLAHQPKQIETLEDYQPELILSGHTHGGQIWPFNYLVQLQQPYVKGLHKLPNGNLIYVNSGIGFWGPPMRLNSQAEITYIT